MRPGLGTLIPVNPKTKGGRTDMPVWGESFDQVARMGEMADQTLFMAKLLKDKGFSSFLTIYINMLSMRMNKLASIG
jgi:hypothetical protein